MSYRENYEYDMYRNTDTKGLGARLIRANTIFGKSVYNLQNEDLGEVEEILLDINTGEVCYIVLSFGGFWGIGNKLYAVPWSSLILDTANKRFTLDVNEEKLKSAPGFYRDDWPDMADSSWQITIQSYYVCDKS